MKILVGLSGGVDSAVAAYLLKEQGHDVTCGFMRNWDSLANNDTLGNPTLTDDICSQEKDYNDAKQVSDQLGLPLIRIDFIAEYWDDVFSTFLQEYRLGNTPNPDILCNRYIKFDAFFKFAMEKGFDYLATGHYAGLKKINNQNYLVKAKDSNKDQSYFLDQVQHSVFNRVLFPLQNLTKIEIREIAQKIGLVVAKKKDSTGICFIGERHFQQFLSNYLDNKEGKIIDIINKKVVGSHLGVMYYTMGQRHGLNINQHKGPYFVCGKDAKNNIIYVATKGHQQLLWDQLIVNRLNWFNLVNEGLVLAKFRYRQPDQRVYIRKDNDKLIVKLVDPIEALTIGQEAVFYNEDGVCLGGGRIDDIFYQNKNHQQRIGEYYQEIKELL